MEKVTVLYPGGFKPPHGGHIDLIKKYAELPEVKEIWVLVGPGVRDGIVQSQAVEMLEKLTEDMKKVVVQGVPWPSPVLAAYKILSLIHISEPTRLLSISYAVFCLKKKKMKTKKEKNKIMHLQINEKIRLH